MPTIPSVSMCSDDFSVLSLSDTLNDATDWYWYTGSCGGTLAGTGTTIFVTPTVTTVYYVRGEGGCVTPGTCGTVTVTVNQRPEADNTNEVITLADCDQANGSITGISATGTSPFQYLWDNDTIYSSNSNLIGAAGGNHFLKIMDANGCWLNFYYYINNPPPPIINNTNLVITKPDCGLTDGSITGVSATGTSPILYSWDNGSTYNSDSSLTGVAAGIYHILVKDGHGCTSSSTYTISGSNNPAVAPAIGGVPSQVCYGSNVSLNIINPPAGSTYSWAGPYGPVGTGTVITINNAGSLSNNNVFVLVTDVNGCQNSSSVSFTVLPSPNVNISPASGCSPVCVNFQSSGSSSGNYFWQFGDGSISTTSSPYHCYNISGGYNVTLILTDSNGCKDSAYATVTVYPIPIAGYSATPQPTTIANPTINFTDLTSGANISSWLWSFDDPTNSTSNLQDPSFTYLDTGTYHVQLVVTSNFGCMDTITQAIVIGPAVDINYFSGINSKVSIYPNPSNNKVTLRSSTELGTIIIYNSLGETVLQTTSKNSIEQIDLRKLPPGIYTVLAQGTCIKLIKE